ncbi:glycosyltransferase family 2 protein [Variovorax sp. HJSM1_2]|uniref:glycosyltransferase family 2 protein n=1 Tax=Variovorax sp. HJSM1_2 TaxID=3366263 RepID=UPI003BF4F759
MHNILVVIPTLNEARGIQPVITRLLEDLPTEASVRLVVMDGGSTDGTVALVEKMAASEPRLQVRPNPKRIQSAAVNLAVRQFGQDAQVLIRCDAHAVYPRGYVRSLVESLQRTGADAVVVPMDSTGDNCVQRAVAWVSDTPLGSGGSAHRGGRKSGFIDHGHHAAFRMASFTRAGGYDESFSHNEDAELDCRQRALGSRIYLDAEIRLGYHPRDTLRGLWRQYFGYGKGRARTVRRHPGSLRPRQLAVPVHLLLSVLCIVLAVWLPWLLVWPALYVAALIGASLMIALRRGSVCGLLAGPAAGVMHAAWASGFVWSFVFLREKQWTPSAASPFWQDSSLPQG